MYVLVTFSCQLATTYNHLERRPKLRNYMDQIDLWAYMWIIYLVVGYGDVIPCTGGHELYNKLR